MHLILMVASLLSIARALHPDDMSLPGCTTAADGRVCAARCVDELPAQHLLEHGCDSFRRNRSAAGC